jgi:hypothetical protein
MIERHVGTVKNLLIKADLSGKDLYACLLEYRNSPLDNDIQSPAQILFGRPVRSFIPSARSNNISNNYEKNSKINHKLKQNQDKYKMYYNRNTKHLPQLNTGDNVIIKNNKQTKYGKIMKSADRPRSFVIKSSNGNIIERNRRQLIKCNKKIIHNDEYILPHSSSKPSYRGNNEYLSSQPNNEMINNNIEDSENHHENRQTALNCNGNKITRYGRIVQTPQRYKE